MRGHLVSEPCDHVGRLRAVREAVGVGVAEVDEVLVRQRDQALVEHRETADAGVEHADRAGIHSAGVYGRRRTARRITFPPWPS